MISFITQNLLWTQGTTVLIFLLIAGITTYLIYKPLLLIVFGLFIFSFFFFRNPMRTCAAVQKDSHLIVSPADGKVIAIEHVEEGSYACKVSIFLSPFDVHVNWIPIDGTIEQVNYKKGSFFPAFLSKSSHLNERNDMVLKTKNGQTIMIRQIAGTIARRIVCWVSEGEQVLCGQKFGMIKFGSRVEVWLPEHVELTIEQDQQVYGGETILGRFI